MLQAGRDVVRRASRSGWIVDQVLEGGDPISRQAPDGNRDVGHHNARLAGHRSGLAEAGRSMTRVTVRHGRRIEVEAVETGAAPRRRLRGHFIQMPLLWLKLLEGASGQTYRLALHLAYLNWRNWKGNAPVVLSNGAARSVGLPRRTKWNGLRELEHRGLVSVERHPRRSPIIRLIL